MLDGDIRINEYSADIIFDNDGDMHVFETWDMRYGDDYNVRFRDIEYDKFPSNYPLPYNSNNIATFNTETYSAEIYKDGVNRTEDARVGYSFNNDLDERFDRVACPSDASRNCESFFINATYIGGLDGQTKFKYEYIIEDVITEYSDISELNWVLFEYAEGNVYDGEINIVLPNNISEYDIFTPNIRNNEVTFNGTNTITINFENMTKNDSLAFRLLVPTTTFSDVAEVNKYLEADMNKQVILDFENNLIEENKIIDYLSISLYIVAIVLSLLSIGAIKVVKKVYFKPPKTDIDDKNIVSPPTDHSPAVVGYLYRGMKLSSEDISATLLDLIYRNYLIVDDSKIFDSINYSVKDLIEGEKERLNNEKNALTKYDDYSNYSNDEYKKFEDTFDIDLILNQEKDLNELKDFEKHLIDWYIDEIGDGTKVSLKDFDDLSKTTLEASKFVKNENDFERQVRSEARKFKFYDKSQYSKRRKAQIAYIIPGLGFTLILIGFLTTNYINMFHFAPLLLGLFYLITEIPKLKLRSIEGQEFYLSWTKYRDNLENLNVVKDADINAVEFWDHNLIYATVFGFADKVLDQLQVKLADNNEYQTQTSRYNGRQYNYYRHSYFVRRLSHSHSDNFHKANNRVIQSRRSSSGGGFSGGGSFGGGGGGGRSR
jgi:uncharacterized membrane protein